MTQKNNQIKFLKFVMYHYKHFSRQLYILRVTYRQKEKDEHEFIIS